MMTLLLIIPFTGGIIAWIAGKKSYRIASVVSLITMGIVLILTSAFFINSINNQSWNDDFKVKWIPILGISFHLFLDGMSLLFVLLTAFIGFLSVLVSWNEIRERAGFYYFNLLWILTGIMGVFMAADMFLFYFFWELMLVPMYFLIGIYGHGNKTYASNKFFLYTQASGLLMLVSILALFFIHGRNTGVYTFDYQALLGTPMTYRVSQLIMAGFLAAFLVKLPVVPLHNWLPDAHSEAPTAGSVILAALMLKTGAYGLIRFVIPLFPDASAAFAPAGMILGVIGIIYGAHMALAQTDLKRLVAYTSVSHMGFIMVGLFAFNILAFQGVIVQIIAHALSTGALFIIAGQLTERLHTRDLKMMGGFWAAMPFMGGMALIASLASLGLPGMINFVAEFMILTGAFQTNILITVPASIGLVFATLYSLRVMRRIFYGSYEREEKLKDYSAREGFIMILIVIMLVVAGLFPSNILDSSRTPVTKILHEAGNAIQSSAIDLKNK